MRTLTFPLSILSEVPEAFCGGVAGAARAARRGQAQAGSIHRGVHP
jgi:hypothetical protein